MKTTEQLEKMDLNSLREYADSVFSPYFVSEGEGETKASQLVTATCKIVYRYFNDWDRFDRSNCAHLETYVNWIRKNCFKMKSTSDYKEKLKYLLIRAIQNIDSYANQPKIWTVYKMD